MQREDVFALRVSIAMHAVLLTTLGTTQPPDKHDSKRKQYFQTLEVELVVLPASSSAPIAVGVGRSPAEVDDNCDSRPSRRLPPEVVVLFDIPEGTVASSLHAFSSRTGLTFMMEATPLEGRPSAGLRGLFTPSDAADRLLEGTGFCPLWLDGGLVIEPCTATPRFARSRPRFGASPTATDPCSPDAPVVVPELEPLPRMSIA